MANGEHVALLRQGMDAWNAWRAENPKIEPDLSRADLSKANFFWADLSRADLREADLRGANLQEADLSRADLSGADLRGADLSEANLSEANLSKANLSKANLSGAKLREANLSKTDLSKANLSGAKLSGAKLSEANLFWANLSEADFSGADLRGADLRFATLVQAELVEADLTSCRIYGVSAWGLKLEEAKQKNLIITNVDEPEITVDNIEVAQFIYLLLHNQKIRDVIDTITSKAVLIIGRFTEERKLVLNALREELRKSEHNYVPILFDFEKPASQNVTGTVLTLARMARFIIADLTDPSSIPYELGRIVPNTKVPVQPILLSGKREFAMFPDLHDYQWVLPIHYYETQEQLIANLKEQVIRPAERKALELRPGAKEVP